MVQFEYLFTIKYFTLILGCVYEELFLEAALENV